MPTKSSKKKSAADRLVDEALEVAAMGLPVFPVKNDKRPALAKADGWVSSEGKGGSAIATTDPEIIKMMFASPQCAAVAVNMDMADLLAVDLDTYKHEEGSETRTEVDDWIDDMELMQDVKDGVARLHKSKRGGLHVIYRKPKTNPPVIYTGAVEMKGNSNAYILWPTPSSDYEVITDTPLDKLKLPPADALKPLKVLGTGVNGSKYTFDEAITVLQDETKGERHFAINSLAIEIMREDRMLTLEAAKERLFNLVDEHLPMKASRRRELLAMHDGGEIHRALVDLVKGGKKRGMVNEGNEDNVIDAFTDAFANMANNVVPLFDTKGIAENYSMPTPKETKAKAKKDAEAKSNVMKLQDISELNIPDPEWLICEVLPKVGIAAIVGTSGSYKSIFTTALSMAIVGGQTEALGLPPSDAVNVIYFNNEQPTSTILRVAKANIEAMGITSSEAGFEAVGNGPDGLGLLVVNGELQEEALAKLKARIVAGGHRVAVLDTFATLGVEDENKAGDVQKLTNALGEMAAELGILFIVIHHTGKAKGAEDYGGDGDAGRGSSAFRAAFDVVLTAQRTVPPSALGTGNAAKKMRSAIRRTQKAGELASFVSIEGAKNRDAQEMEQKHFRVLVDGKAPAFSTATQNEVDVAFQEFQNRSGAKPHAVTMGKLKKLATSFKWEAGKHKLSADRAGDVLSDKATKRSWDRGELEGLREDAAEPFDIGGVDVWLEDSGNATWLHIGELEA